MTGNLAQLLVTRAQERPDLQVGTLDAPIALSDLLGLAAQGARRLAADGLAEEERVAVVAGSSTDYLVVWAACLLAGVPVALVNPSYPQALLAQMLDHFQPDHVFTDHADTGFVGRRGVSAMTDRPGGFADGLVGCPGLDADRFSIASYMHTSGTTGMPKFCAQSHEYFLRLGTTMSTALDLTREDRLLAPLPLFHVNPLGYGIIGALTAGADALALRTFSARSFWPDVREHGITALSLHAPPVEILKRVTSAEDAEGHRVRTMFYADREFTSRFGIDRAVSGYGSTEAAGISHLHVWRADDDIAEDASRYGGAARTDIEDRLDDSGQILVRERAPGTLFAGYLGRDGLDPARDADGWFATGDLGRRDGDGGLVFLERAAESIRVKGEFVPIPFVEGRLSTITDLEDLALWKKPGELVDDDLVLYVVAASLPVEAIKRSVGELPSFMRPAHIARVGSIPRDAAAGKVQRRLLPDERVLQWVTLD